MVSATHPLATIPKDWVGMRLGAEDQPLLLMSVYRYMHLWNNRGFNVAAGFEPGNQALYA